MDACPPQAAARVVCTGQQSCRPARGEHRHLWALRPDLVYLNHGAFGACPMVVLEEQVCLRALLEADRMDFFVVCDTALWQQTLATLSKFLGADPAEMTHQVNAAAGVNNLLRSLAFRSGDEILVHDHAYQVCRNAVEYVCSRSGARSLVVSLPFSPSTEDEIVDRVLAAATASTRLAMIDTVTSPRLPFERRTGKSQARDVDVLIDAAHGPGIMPMDLESIGAAYVTGDCHKWPCTPKRSGFLYVRSDRRHLVLPVAVSHGYSASVLPTGRFSEEFDWQGTEDPTPLVNFSGGKTRKETLRCVKLDGRMATWGSTAGFDEEVGVRFVFTFEHTILGWGDELGALEAGMLADVLALPADPLADVRVLHNPVGVIANGHWWTTQERRFA
jgi:selenocysteine lyase/cysteine desulfurase